MADGYIDPATGQYVPGSFADQLDLPGPTGGSQADIDAANAAARPSVCSSHPTKPDDADCCIEASPHTIRPAMMTTNGAASSSGIG